jgi:hypothetical protein
MCHGYQILKWKTLACREPDKFIDHGFFGLLISEGNVLKEQLAKLLVRVILWHGVFRTANSVTVNLVILLVI